jgi:hypothetical protein
MSISFKKVNSMIETEVELQEGMSDEQKKVLKELCEKIYMIESSVETGNNQQLIQDVKGQIARRAGDM